MENHLHGRLTTLMKLNEDRNNHELGPVTRLRADKAHYKISQQLKDKKLMSLRERLIKASQAGDKYEMWKISNLMYQHEGKEVEKTE